MTKFKKGESGNPTGRSKGAVNKVTKELRERISDFLDDNWDCIEGDFKALEPEKRIMLFEKLLQYILPRMQSQELDLNADLTNLTEEQLILMCNYLFKRDDENR